MSGSPGGRETSQPDLQELDLRVHAQFVLLQAKDVLMERDAPRGVLTAQQILDLCLDPGLLRPEVFDFPFYAFNLSRF